MKHNMCTVGIDLAKKIFHLMGMMSWVAIRSFATRSASGVSVMCWGSRAPRRCATWRRRGLRMQDVAVPRKLRGNR